MTHFIDSESSFAWNGFPLFLMVSVADNRVDYPLIINHSNAVSVGEIQRPVRCERHSFWIYEPSLRTGSAITAPERVVWETTVAITHHYIQISFRIIHFIDTKQRHQKEIRI